MQSNSRRIVEGTGLIAFAVEGKSKYCPNNRNQLNGPETWKTSRLSPGLQVGQLT
jgi:hypothetical protein